MKKQSQSLILLKWDKSATGFYIQKQEIMMMIRGGKVEKKKRIRRGGGGEEEKDHELLKNLHVQTCCRGANRNRRYNKTVNVHII